jgi:hypothetical protein
MGHHRSLWLISSRGVGAGFVFQFAFFDSQCGLQGLTANDGLWFAIQ